MLEMFHTSLAVSDRVRIYPCAAAALESSLKKYLGHHALVFVAQEMAVEERYSLNDGVRKVHY